MRKVDFNKVVNRKGTYCTQWDYTKDRFGHEDVLPFSISDMDFALPYEMVEYLQESLKDGIYGYTRWRNNELLEAISKWYMRSFETKIDSSTITYSPTVIYSVSELIRMKSQENDKVMLMTPAYDAFFNVIKLNKREDIRSELIDDNGEFYLNQEDFLDKIKTAKILLFCSPHNPVGKVWSKEELEFIVLACKKYGVYIISDEIHMDMAFYKQHTPIIEVARNLNYSDNVAICTSATKSFNFPALLFSYLILENKNDKEEFERILKGQNGLSSCTILGMKATIFAYNNLEHWLKDLKDYVYENYKYLEEFIKANNLKLFPAKLEGTYLLWIKADAYNIHKLLDIMYNQTKVGIMSGEIYGQSDYLRINIGCPRSKLEEGLKRLNESIKILEEEKNEG